MNFERNMNAPDGIHEVVEFNEYKSALWWEKHRRRSELLNRIMPFAITAFIVIGFCIVGYMEKAL